MNLKIALIHPDYSNKINEIISIPLGLAWISAYLKNQGIETKCFDFSINKDGKKNFFSDFYDVVCIQVQSYETFNDSLSLIREVRNKSPKSIIIAGGIHASLNWKSLLDNKEIDFVIIGEGEIVIYKLLIEISKEIIDYNEIEKIKGIAFNLDNKKIFTGEADIMECIDLLPEPDREAFTPQLYPQWTIMTSRGCCYSCKFCTMASSSHGKIRLRSAESVFNEIMRLNKAYNMKRFFILDDTFTVNRERVIDLCTLLIKERLEVRWACLTRIDRIDEELLGYMKAAGCFQISFGIESANQKTLDFLSKGINASSIENNLKLVRKCGLKSRCSFIFGLPFENKDDILQTIELIEDTEPDEIQIYPLIPYPGTFIYENREICDIRNIREFKKKSAMFPIVSTNSITELELTDMVKLCVNKMRKKGYLCIPDDIENKKQSIDKVIMTEFSPIQDL